MPTTDHPLLPADIARCANTDCPLRARCRRSEPGHPVPYRQVYAAFEPERTADGWDCEGWLRVREAAL